MKRLVFTLGRAYRTSFSKGDYLVTEYVYANTIIPFNLGER